MKSKLFKPSIMLLFFGLVLVFAGCSGKSSVQSTNTGSKNIVGKKPQKEVTIAYVSSEMPAPQALIGKKEKIFENMLAEQGYTVKWISTRSRDKTGQLMDKKGADFFYLFTSNFTSYLTETTPTWGGSDNYRIIAGALNKPTYLLVLNPKIKSLKDLDGKTVGISNHNYMEEMLLNYELQKVGLKTKSMGGTVNVEYQDVNVQFIKNFAQGKYAAISSWLALKPSIIKAVPNAQFLPLMTIGKPTLGYINLLATKDVIRSNPDLVKLVLKAHLKACESAKSDEADLPMMVKTDWENYYKALHALNYPKYPIEYFKNHWKNIEITYVPDTDLLKKVAEFDIKAGYLKNKTYDNNFVDLTLLNEVLRETGKPTVN